jgi:aryl-alcohol dehydrogenase-like predicted oxidoreductase
VFQLCLGGNVFGWTIDEQRSFEVLDAYAAAGGNFIDTADVYGGSGASERIIGSWLAARGNREQVVIATKVGMSGQRPGLSAANIAAAIEDSLERLQTDRVDLYYSHQEDPATPLEETLGAFQRLIDEGKIRHAAASNYTAERLEEALELGQRQGLAAYVALQPHYNLLERDYERELRPLSERHELGCLPYFGLARGFLTGKYRENGPKVDSPRAASIQQRYFNRRGWGVVETLDEIAAAHDSTLAAVALAWLRQQPTVVAPIASATSPEQLAELLPSLRLELSADELTRLDLVSEG